MPKDGQEAANMTQGKYINIIQLFQCMTFWMVVLHESYYVYIFERFYEFSSSSIQETRIQKLPGWLLFLIPHPIFR